MLEPFSHLGWLLSGMDAPLLSSLYLSSEEEEELGPGTSGEVSTGVHVDMNQGVEYSSLTEQPQLEQSVVQQDEPEQRATAAAS